MKTYPNYKDSGVSWLGDVPEHWEIRKLRTIGDFYSGLTDKKGTDFHQEFNILNKPFIPFTNIFRNTYIDTTKTQSVIVDSARENQTPVQKGDVFFLMSSENFEDLGKCSLLKDEVGEMYLNSFCKGFRIKGNNIFPKFLNYQLSSKTFKELISKEGNGFTRINLKLSKLKSCISVIPHKTEQQQIARYLDWQSSKINQFIKAKKKLIALLKEQKQNIINEAVTKGINPDAPMKDSGVEWLGEIPAHWEVRKLKYCVTNKNIQSDSCTENETYLALEHIEGWTGKISVTAEKAEFDSKVKKYNAGDILFGKLRPYLAKVALPNFNGVCVGEFLVLQPKEIISSYFLSVLLRSKKIIDLVNSSTFGAKMPRADWDFIGSIFIPLLSTEEQQSIVTHIEKETALINKTITRTEREIELIQEYRTRLISDVVTGKVDIRSVEIPDFEPVETELEAQDDEASEDELIAEDIKE